MSMMATVISSVLLTFWAEKSIITYSKKTWWITGFNPNPKYLDAKASDLNVKFTVRFTKSSLYRSFKNAWRKMEL